MSNFNELFFKYFEPYPDNYVIIGGTAASILMNKAGFSYRSTQDYDIVLIFENLNDSFILAFQRFIFDGDYLENFSNSITCNFFRFTKPQTPGFPKMIELFSRKPDNINLHVINNKTPIHIDDTLPSLSALLLNEHYYRLLLSGRVIIHGLSILDTAYLIPFKIKAWLDLSEQKEDGASRISKDIQKHLLDVFRLHEILERVCQIRVNGNIKEDIMLFINKVYALGFDPTTRIKNYGSSLDEVMTNFKNIYLG